MKPAMCRVKHDPENNLYGDCLRASVATILDIDDPDEVPHFVHDGCDAETLIKRIEEYANSVGLHPFYVHFDSSANREDILNGIETTNPGVSFLLFGNNGENDHVLVCGKGRVLHDVAWVKTPMTKPQSSGFWSILVFLSIKHKLK